MIAIIVILLIILFILYNKENFTGFRKLGIYQQYLDSDLFPFLPRRRQQCLHH